MIGQFLLTFREVLEAALITAIVLAYLARTGRQQFFSHVWRGVLLAVVSSLAVGEIIWFTFGNITGPIKALFEGTTALLATSVLSIMIYWMATKGKELKAEVERKVESSLSQGSALALTFFAFTVLFREGLETVLFLTPFLFEDAIATLLGATAGTATSLALAYAVYVVGMRINIRRFFYYTSMLLVLLAAGLAGYGVHELVEYSKDIGIILGWLGEPAYVLAVPEGNPLHHKGFIGSILAVMFGYTVKAEWARVIIHLAYLTVTLPMIILAYKRPVHSRP